MTFPDDGTGVRIYEVDGPFPLPHVHSLTYNRPQATPDPGEDDPSGTRQGHRRPEPAMRKASTMKATSKEVKAGYTTESSSDYEPAVEQLTPMEAFKRKVDGNESPFPEVQACVPTDDDPTIMINRKSFPLRTQSHRLTKGLRRRLSNVVPVDSLCRLVRRREPVLCVSQLCDTSIKIPANPT